jgi:hypothetical protein
LEIFSLKFWKEFQIKTFGKPFLDCLEAMPTHPKAISKTKSGKLSKVGIDKTSYDQNFDWGILTTQV